MPAFRPFRALRYDPQRVGDLSRVLAPPYDVIGPEAQASLHAASPHNVVRLIRGQSTPADTDTDNVYTRARRTFDAWREQRILRADPAPAFYVLEQTFGWQGRTCRRLGVVGLLELTDPDPGILRHEATLDGPRADRTRLLDAVPANLSPVFCVTPDTDGPLEAALQRAAGAASPAVETTLGDDAVRLWAITDASAQRQIEAAAARAAWLIADGPHRFAVAWSRRERYTAVMTYLVSMEDPGLLMRAIHRVIQRAAPLTWDPLEAWATRQAMPSLEALLAWLAEPAGPGRFGYLDAAGRWAVTVREARRGDEPLDVVILHDGLLPAQGVETAEVTYRADAAAAAEALRAGRASGVWLLRPLHVDAVYQMAARGHTLPPKSTFFFPKVPSGLAFNLLADAPSPVR